MQMTPKDLIQKWSRSDRTERQGAQEHFIDLCRVIGEPTPNEAADPESYTFEKGVSKVDGTGGFADVWKRHRCVRAPRPYPIGSPYLFAMNVRVGSQHESGPASFGISLRRELAKNNPLGLWYSLRCPLDVSAPEN
jgi:hypothetical protein